MLFISIRFEAFFFFNIMNYSSSVITHRPRTFRYFSRQLQTAEIWMQNHTIKQKDKLRLSSLTSSISL
jgi:hypothetical protein